LQPCCSSEDIKYKPLIVYTKKISVYNFHPWNEDLKPWKSFPVAPASPTGRSWIFWQVELGLKQDSGANPTTFEFTYI
jgi:hypothetical protein